jgi:hypothetical protein
VRDHIRLLNESITFNSAESLSGCCAAEASVPLQRHPDLLRIRGPVRNNDACRHLPSIDPVHAKNLWHA